MLPQVKAVLETCLYVNDLRAAEVFYRDVLGLTVVARQEGRHVFLRCGGSMILLFNPEESARPDAPVPPHGARGATHLALAVEQRDLEPWKGHLQACGVAIEKIVQWPHGGTSVYFRDPAGNSLELAETRIWDGLRPV